MSGKSIEDVLHEAIATAVGIDSDDIDDDTQLGPEGLDISSLAVFEIVERLEMELDIEIPDEEIENIHPEDEDDGATVGDLKELIDERVADAA